MKQPKRSLFAGIPWLVVALSALCSTYAIVNWTGSPMDMFNLACTVLTLGCCIVIVACNVVLRTIDRGVKRQLDEVLS